MTTLAVALILTAFASTLASAQSGRPTVPVPVPDQPCVKEPCGLIGRSRHPINQEPMNEEARAFLQTRLLPAISRKIAASDYFRKKKAENHCRVTFGIVIAPGKTVSSISNLQERDEFFFEEFAIIVRETVEEWKGEFPDDVFDKLFTITIGYSLLPCRPMRRFAK